MHLLRITRRIARALLLPLAFLLSLSAATQAHSQGQHYGAIFSPDLVHWSDALSKIDFPPGMRHGSFLRLNQSEYDRLNALAPPTTPSVSTRSAAPPAGPK